MTLPEVLRPGAFMTSDPVRTPTQAATQQKAHETPVAPRKRGRPLEMTRETLLSKIRDLAQREEGLFKIHRTHSALYARARRLFGSWGEAVRHAGINYDATIDRARARSVRSRRKRSQQ